MNHYLVTIVFKDRKDLTLKLDAEEGLRNRIANELNRWWWRSKTLYIGDYIFMKRDILYIEVKGNDNIEEHSGK